MDTVSTDPRSSSATVEDEDVLLLPEPFRRAMVEQAERDMPNEACGLLAGRDGRIEHLFAMRNADESPVTYRLDPKEQLQVFNEIEERGWELLGIYHSHTHSAAYPSETDRRQAFYPEASYILVSLADPSSPVVRSYRIRDGIVREQRVVEV